MPHCTHRAASGTTCPSASVVRFLALRLNIFKKAKATPIYNQSFKMKNGYCLKKLYYFIQMCIVMNVMSIKKISSAARMAKNQFGIRARHG
jgi:hypothetical protein